MRNCTKLWRRRHMGVVYISGNDLLHGHKRNETRSIFSITSKRKGRSMSTMMFRQMVTSLYNNHQGLMFWQNELFSCLDKMCCIHWWATLCCAKSSNTYTRYSLALWRSYIVICHCQLGLQLLQVMRLYWMQTGILNSLLGHWMQTLLSKWSTKVSFLQKKDYYYGFFIK